MPISNKTVKELVERYKQISLLVKINAVLGWDLNVNLPPKAAEGRASQIAFLTEMVTDRWLDPEFRSLLDKATIHIDKLNEEERAIIRNINWQGKIYFKVPKDIVVEKSRTTSEAFMVWQEAKKKDQFKDFLPHLEKIVRLNQIIAEHLGYKENPYDALIDFYEQNATASYCQKMFNTIQPELTKLIKKIQGSSLYKERNELIGKGIHYPIPSQKQLAAYLMKKMGYDLDAGRIDDSAHPITVTLDRYDVRITNKYLEDDFRSSFTAVIHESGHALYELGVNPDFADTPLDGGISIGVHESQSRFWENQVGKNPAFLKFLTPTLQAFYQEQLAGVGEETITRLFNKVEPGFIRIEADEVTYNLHVILRFELENDLINNRVKPKDIPEAWRAKMKAYLGIVPPTDREGALQDVHWSYGDFGYFPTYTLGNLYSAQFTAKMKQGLDLDQLLEKGDLGTPLSWLRENIHQYGALYWPDELVNKITGQQLDPKYFLDYITRKYSEMYKLKTA